MNATTFFASSSSEKQGLLRVLHTADWHLGKYLCDQSREQEHEAFLGWLEALVVDQMIDVLVVAGDIFDSANPPHSATTMLYRFLTSLHQKSNCEVILIAGNHDSAKQLESVAPLLRTHRVHVIGSLPEVLSDCIVPIGNPVRLVIAAIPFLRDRDVRISQPGESAEDIQQSMIRGIQAIYDQAAQRIESMHGNTIPVLATGHLTTLGSSSSDSERAIHVGGLGAFPSQSFSSRFQYVALGHLHRPQDVDKQGRVFYSGSPIPLSFSETEDRKQVRLLQFDSAGLVSQKSIETPQLRKFLRLSIMAKDVQQVLENFQWPESPFGCWVELTLQDTNAQTPAAEQIRGFVKDSAVTILQIRTMNSNVDSSLTTEPGMNVVEAIKFLREEPKRVFTQRLEVEDFSEETVQSLQIEFDKVVEVVLAEE